MELLTEELSYEGRYYGGRATPDERTDFVSTKRLGAMAGYHRVIILLERACLK